MNSFKLFFSIFNLINKNKKWEENYLHTLVEQISFFEMVYDMNIVK